MVSGICVPLLGLDWGGNQFLICDAMAHDSRYKAIQPLQRVPLHVAIVQAPSEFIDVPLDVFFARMMINAVNTMLHNSPNRFNTVRCDAIAGVFVLYVVYRCVFEFSSPDSYKRRVRRVNGRTLLDILLNRVVQADFSRSRDGVASARRPRCASLITAVLPTGPTPKFCRL